jgi:hypothetical protein
MMTKYLEEISLCVMMAKVNLYIREALQVATCQKVREERLHLAMESFFQGCV